MNINNVSATPNFQGVHVSKATKGIMMARGEYDAFNKVLPEFERRGKKANLTFYAVNSFAGGYPRVTYGLSIRPLNKLKDNSVTKALGLSNFKPADSFINIDNQMANENTFRALYDSAYTSRNYYKKSKSLLEKMYE